MQISVLASGSSGNSTYIESKYSKILIDAGISLRKLTKKLNYLGTDVSEIDAVFVTHEHIDHVSGLIKLNKPVYVSKATYNALGFRPGIPRLIEDKIKFDGLEIERIATNHDAIDPCGYLVSDNNSKVGVFTDLGKIDDKIKSATEQVKCMVLETNHDIEMLINGHYPFHLKQRILSDKGHLSNIDAGILVKDINNENLNTVFLAHLSKNNNTPELALDTFSKLTEKKNINKILTSYESTDLIKI